MKFVRWLRQQLTEKQIRDMVKRMTETGHIDDGGAYMLEGRLDLTDDEIDEAITRGRNQ